MCSQSNQEELLDKEINQVFAKDVLTGLSAENKFLYSRYFYDAKGDKLFQAIMSSPEYYLTDSEFEVFQDQGDDLAGALKSEQPFELVELGSGDGLKSRLLLDALHRSDADFIYRPVDISDHSLELLKNRLLPDMPWLQMQPLHGDYSVILKSLEAGEQRRVFVFLGSNLGNFRFDNAIAFLKLIRSAMGEQDLLLIGLDLKKDPRKILAAYNDSQGYTRDFNLNLLSRINRELGGDFDLDKFVHYPVYDPETGAAKSFLVSTEDQQIYIQALERDFKFKAGEVIFMETSQKYDRELIAQLTRASGFQLQQSFYDSQRNFTNQIWAPVV